MTITKPNGDVITCTVEEYKQIYKPAMEYINVPDVRLLDDCKVKSRYCTTSTSAILDES